jgi:hypothetical protein
VALNHSPQVVTNGLVFYYDMANGQKSWKGAPTTNIHPIDGYISWPAQTLHFWNGNNWVVDSTYTHPGVAGPAGIYLGKVRKYTSGALTAVWSNTSHAYILKTAPMTSGQSYAMSAYTFLSSDCNIDGMNSSIEGASVSALAGGYVTGYDTSRKGTWQRQGLQGTGSGNVNFILAYPYRGGVTDGSFTGSMLVGGAQVEFGTFPTPYTDDTRSNTQAIVDLTGRRTIGVGGSPAYGSDGTFTFSSSGSTTLNLGSGNNFLPMPSLTLEAWIKTPGLGSGMSVNGIWGFTYGIRFNAASDGSLYFIIGTDVTTFVNIATSGVNVNDNNWHHVVAVKNGDSSCAIYVDGVVRASGTPVAGWSGTNPWAAMEIQVGRDQNDAPYFFNGRIDVGRVYNRALSATEVQQNFNAQRGRYGI